LNKKSMTKANLNLSTDQAKTASANRSRVTEHREHLLKRGSYTIKPNELEMAWFKKDISHHCYLLVSYLIFHNEDWIIWHSSLVELFSNNDRTLRQAVNEALERKMIVREKNHRKVSYYVTCANEWNLSSLEFSHSDKSHPEDSHTDKSHPEKSQPENCHTEKSQPEKSQPITIPTGNQTNLKTKRIKKQNQYGGEDARACAYDQTNESDKKAPPTPLADEECSTSEIVSLSKRLERFYLTKKGYPLSYDYREANKASKALFERGEEYVERFIKFLDEYYGRQKFFVHRDMWNPVYRQLEETEKFQNESYYFDDPPQETWNVRDDFPF